MPFEVLIDTLGNDSFDVVEEKIDGGFSLEKFYHRTVFAGIGLVAEPGNGSLGQRELRDLKGRARQSKMWPQPLPEGSEGRPCLKLKLLTVTVRVFCSVFSWLALDCVASLNAEH